jgi:hypothetical protein
MLALPGYFIAEVICLTHIDHAATFQSAQLTSASSSDAD